MLKLILVLFFSLLVGIGRLFVTGHELSLSGSYEAIAHIWVGALLVLSYRWGNSGNSGNSLEDSIWNYFTILASVGSLVALTVLEVVMFTLK